MSADARNRIVDAITEDLPELLENFSQAELREQSEQFTAALVAIGRQRTAQRDPLE